MTNLLFVRRKVTVSIPISLVSRARTTIARLPMAFSRSPALNLSPGYTEEIGIAPGIDSDPSTPSSPTTLKPTLDALAARSGGSVWEDAGNYTGKSADVTITLTNAGQPEQIRIRVRLRKK